jgi:hypothetical protein
MEVIGITAASQFDRRDSPSRATVDIQIKRFS